METAYLPPLSWSTSKKIWFRFGFIFFIVYMIFLPNGTLPYWEYAHEVYIQPFHKFIPWVGKHILKLPYEITQFTYGSGDTTYDYLMLALNLILAILGTVIWTIVDRKRQHYQVLHYWLTVIVRYYVAFTMFVYGTPKVIQLQFPFPDNYLLIRPYGSASPMGLAWRFFGYSRGYNIFIGMGEIVSGFLLLFRKTNRLGSIITLSVVINIVLVNYCFDVCVKLFSSVLLIMTIYLLMQNKKCHASFFMSDKETAKAQLYKAAFAKKWKNISLLVVKFALIAFILFTDFTEIWAAAKEFGDVAPKPPLYGIYDVQTFIRNNDSIPPLITDTTRWQRLIVYASKEGASVTLMNDTTRSYVFRTDCITKTVTMFTKADTTKRSIFRYSNFGKDELVLRGRILNDSAVISMKLFPESNFLLVNRGFHLVSEEPFNR